MSVPQSSQTSAPVPTCLATSPTQTEWFTREVHAHDSQLKSYLRGSFPTVRDIDDVVQESYLRIWRARLGQPIRSAKSFLFQIARNLAVDTVRRNGISPEIPCPDLDVLLVTEDRPGIADTVCTNEELDLLAQAIQSLPTRCREVMILRQIKGRSQKEIAFALSLSELSVQTYVVRGLRRMEEFMRKHHARR
jgi:RNA polymerase sigma-70 factor (ECF subfamily)